MSASQVGHADKMEELSGRQAFALAALAAAILLSEGFVIQHFWNWFVVPAGGKDISLRTGIGLSVLVAFVRFNGKSIKIIRFDEAVSSAGYAIATIVVFYLIGLFVYAVG